ncbi:MAG: hypothetical protein FD138_4756 [Planctomycetota bacterium]|nr:MAG: hypothetical protein FD138_4756 [Planctomycetota bacterium]
MLIGVVPSLLNSVPPVMPLILKCVTSALSAALRLMTMAPESVSSSVERFATCGVSPTGVTVIEHVAGLASAATDEPFFESSTTKLPAVLLFGDGRNLIPACPCATVMKSPLLIGVAPLF